MGTTESGWSIAGGILFIILGFIAIFEPAVAGLAMTVLVGWLLIFGGAIDIIGAFGSDGFARMTWEVTLGIIYLVAGFYFITHPSLGLETLTLLLAGVFLVEGILKGADYVRTYRERGSAWLLLSALTSIVLAWLIWVGWPSSSAWAIGTLVGVNLLMTGYLRLMLGVVVRPFPNVKG